MSINDRIKAIRTALKKTQIEFAKAIGLTQSTLSSIEKGDTIVSERNIILVCKEFGVNEEWLRNGNGEMFQSKGNLVELLNININKLDEMDRKIIIEYIKLNPKQREVIKGFIKSLF